MGQLATFEKNAFDLYVRSRSNDLETSRELQSTAIQLRQVSDQFSPLISSFESVGGALQEQTLQMKLMTKVLDKQTQLSTAILMTQDTLNRGIEEITELTANINELAITTTSVQRNSTSANRELQVLAQTVTDATVSLESGVQLTKSSNLILQRDINKLYSSLNKISVDISQLGPLLTSSSSSQTIEFSPVVKSIEDLSLKLEKLFLTYQVCFESALRESRQTHSS
jgi:methyl-accepting chemotaxis protein